MNKEKQEKVLADFQEIMKNVISSKGDDYANKDRLINFKRVAFMCDVTPQKAIQILIATKVARLTELYSGKEPNHESVKDTKIDLANYTALLEMIDVEKEEEAAKMISTTNDWQDQPHY